MKQQGSSVTQTSKTFSIRLFNFGQEDGENRQEIAEGKKAKPLSAGEKRKQAAGLKKAKAAAAAEERKRVTKTKKTRIQQDQAKKAIDALENAQPGSTISLGFFKFGQTDDSKDAAPKKNAKKAASAPLGVPTIYKWRQNRDGSISGMVYGSKAFREGESITTSPMSTDITESAVVQTLSGSR